MTITQELEKVEENNHFESTITVTDVPKGKFLVVRALLAYDPKQDRDPHKTIVLTMQNGGDWADGGTITIKSGMFSRHADETAVTVIVEDEGSDGEDLASHTVDF